MRRVSVLRQLGRCAGFSLARPTSWGANNTVAACSGLSRRQGGAFDIHAQLFTTSPTLQAPWKVTPPLTPTVQPSTDSPTAFADLAAPEQFRSVMRLLPNSVVVCTSAPSTGSSATPRGMTMSSLTSLALHPTPLLTFNVGTPSRTLDAITASRTFNIHVLRGDAEGTRVAEWFRRGNAVEGLGVFEAEGMRAGCGCEVSGEVESGAAGDMAPLLRGMGVLYGLRCKLLNDEPHRGLVRVRDHVVVLAEVVGIMEGVGGREGDEEFGLVYADRRYRQLGGTMVHEE